MHFLIYMEAEETEWERREPGRRGWAERERGREEVERGDYCFCFHHTESLLRYQRCVHHHLRLWYVREYIYRGLILCLLIASKPQS